jgi:hypothetical protein
MTNLPDEETDEPLTVSGPVFESNAPSSEMAVDSF